MPFWSSKDKDKGAHAPTQDPLALIARREYDKAIKVYRAQLAARPDDYNLNHRIADVLSLAGRSRDAMADYQAAASGFAREGFLVKAVAILKKMQRIDPGNPAIQAKLAELSRSASSASRMSPAARPSAAPPPRGAGEDLELDMEPMEEERAPIPVSSMDPPASAPSLNATPLFSDFSPGELSGVLGRLRHRSFPAGSVVVGEGDPGDSLFVVGGGRVKVATRGPDGRSIDLAELKEGDFFGEVSLLTGKPRTATITSLEETDLLELTRADLEALEAAHPRVREVIQQFYEKRVASTVEAMIQASRSARKPRS
jgi:cAMP-dependent protein kinase regulator